MKTCRQVVAIFSIFSCFIDVVILSFLDAGGYLERLWVLLLSHKLVISKYVLSSMFDRDGIIKYRLPK